MVQTRPPSKIAKPKKSTSSVKKTISKKTEKRKISVDSLVDCGETKTNTGITACKKKLCEELRGESVVQLRAFAKMLGVPNFACVSKNDLCKAIDAQVTTYFALQSFDAGSKKNKEIINELLLKVGNKGEKLKISLEKSKFMSASLLSVLLLMLEKYNEMVGLALVSGTLTQDERNKKLSSTGTEAIVYLRSALLGVGGSFVDPEMLRR